MWHLNSSLQLLLERDDLLRDEEDVRRRERRSGVSVGDRRKLLRIGDRSGHDSLDRNGRLRDCRGRDGSKDLRSRWKGHWGRRSRMSWDGRGGWRHKDCRVGDRSWVDHSWLRLRRRDVASPEGMVRAATGVAAAAATPRPGAVLSSIASAVDARMQRQRHDEGRNGGGTGRRCGKSLRERRAELADAKAKKENAPALTWVRSEGTRGRERERRRERQTRRPR